MRRIKNNDFTKRPSNRVLRVTSDDAGILDRLSGGDSGRIDAFLLPRLNYLKKTYKRIGDPRIVYLAASGIEQTLSQFPAAQKSFQYSRLLALMSEMLIAEGNNAGAILLALKRIETAIEVLDAVDVINDETLRARIEYSLYRGIAQKALGKFEESLTGMRATIEDLSTRANYSMVDLVMLRRQEVIMLQALEGHRRLAEDAALYVRQKPVEYYGTIKRVFEFAMNKRLPDARVIFPEFKRAYSVIKEKLPTLSHISFTKNVGQFLIQNGKTAQAISILERASFSAGELNLYGQQKQLNLLIEDGKNNNPRGLATFRVGEQ